MSDSIKGPAPAPTKLDGSSLRIAIVHSRWNKTVVDALVAGTIKKLKETGVKESNIVVQSVPGSFELPLACSKVIFGSHVQAGATATDLLGGLSSLMSPNPTSRTSTPAPQIATMPHQPFDAVIAIGVLIKGSTMHFEYICESVSHALMRVQLDTGVPVIFGVLTALTDDQALERAGIGRGANKGHNHGAANLQFIVLRFNLFLASLCAIPGRDEEEGSAYGCLGEWEDVYAFPDLDAFMDSYLSIQQSTIFQHVGVMIYVFEVETRNMEKDLDYYKACLAALKRYSPNAAVFLLVHKMDLARGPKAETLARKAKELKEASGDAEVTVFGTSIYDESLYNAWSRIVHILIPNASVLSRHLAKLAAACSATEVVLFERTTFLVIATSTPPPPPPVASAVAVASAASSSKTNGHQSVGSSHEDHVAEPDPDPHKMAPTRYERTSELIKAFKYSCARVREEFYALEMELPEFTAVLDELTRNTYVLIIVHDPTIETAALRMNIRLARPKFEELQGDSLLS
ncbi:hypothetical protein BN946_scf185014.g89 [Trametes cinnabarina]|uniref:6,7-dimethyl-8-ribityllumazine synthase n=1 Tax=Pycnoporus cinnabarinus TaxID=5643 RepID=A0A060SN02_PYCCI|nr:hypothetical protein BN946_scf185014.g89 [Trametes cinnabarina]